MTSVTFVNSNFMLTFDPPDLPMRVPVRTYLLNPLKCMKCQKFGQPKFNCRRNNACPHGRSDHGVKECRNELKLTGVHSSFSMTSLVWIHEKGIQDIRAFKESYSWASYLKAWDFSGFKVFNRNSRFLTFTRTIFLFFYL